MDDNTRDVAIALITSGFAFLTAVAVAVFIAGRDRRLETMRWRRELYASFMRLARTTADVASPWHRGPPPAADELDSAMNELLALHFEIVLIRPELEQATTDVLDGLGNMLNEATGPAPTPEEVWAHSEAWERHQNQYFNAWEAFREAAQRDLGTSTGPMWRVRKRLHYWRIRDTIQRDDDNVPLVDTPGPGDYPSQADYHGPPPTERE